MTRIQFGSYWNLELYQVNNGQPEAVTTHEQQAELAPILVPYGVQAGILQREGGLVMAMNDHKGPDDASKIRRAQRSAENPPPGTGVREYLEQQLSETIPPRVNLDTLKAYFVVDPGRGATLVNMALVPKGKSEGDLPVEPEAGKAGAGVPDDQNLTPELTSLAALIREKAKEDAEQ